MPERAPSRITDRQEWAVPPRAWQAAGLADAIGLGASQIATTCF
jgi:hypothetical protein